MHDKNQSKLTLSKPSNLLNITDPLSLVDHHSNRNHDAMLWNSDSILIVKKGVAHELTLIVGTSTVESSEGSLDMNYYHLLECSDLLQSSDRIQMVDDKSHPSPSSIFCGNATISSALKNSLSYLSIKNSPLQDKQSSDQQVVSLNQGISNIDIFRPVAIVSTSLSFVARRNISKVIEKTNLSVKCMQSSASAIALAFLTTDTAVSLLKVKVGMITFMLTEIDQDSISCSLIEVEGVFNHSCEIILHPPSNDKESGHYDRNDHNNNDDIDISSHEEEEKEEKKEGEDILPKHSINEVSDVTKTNYINTEKNKLENVQLRVLHSVSECSGGFRALDMQLLQHWFAVLYQLNKLENDEENTDLDKTISIIVQEGETIWNEHLSEETRRHCLTAMKLFRNTASFSSSLSSSSPISSVVEQDDFEDIEAKEWCVKDKLKHMLLQASASLSDRIHILHAFLTCMVATNDFNISISCLFQTSRRTQSLKVFEQLIQQYGQDTLTITSSNNKYRFLLKHDGCRSRIKSLWQRTMAAYQQQQQFKRLACPHFLKPKHIIPNDDKDWLDAIVIWQTGHYDVAMSDIVLTNNATASLPAATVPVYHLPSNALLHGTEIMTKYLYDYETSIACDSFNRVNIIDSSAIGNCDTDRIGIVVYPFSASRYTQSTTEQRQVHISNHVQSHPESISWLEPSLLPLRYYLIDVKELFLPNKKKDETVCQLLPCDIHRIGNTHHQQQEEKEKWKKELWGKWQQQHNNDDSKVDAFFSSSSSLYLITQDVHDHKHGETIFPVLYEIIPSVYHTTSAAPVTLTAVVHQGTNNKIPHSLSHIAHPDPDALPPDSKEDDDKDNNDGDEVVWVFALVMQCKTMNDDDDTNNHAEVLQSLPITNHNNDNNSNDYHQLLTIRCDGRMMNLQMQLNPLSTTIAQYPNPNQFYSPWHECLPPGYIPWLLLLLFLFLLLLIMIVCWTSLLQQQLKMIWLTSW